MAVFNVVGFIVIQCLLL